MSELRTIVIESSTLEAERMSIHRVSPNKDQQATVKLRQIGVTQLGARQVLNGEVVTLPSDRKLLATAVRQAVAGMRTEKLNNKYKENMHHEER